jgi:hypothetical protein
VLKNFPKPFAHEGHGSVSTVQQNHDVTEPRPEGEVYADGFHTDSNARGSDGGVYRAATVRESVPKEKK